MTFFTVYIFKVIFLIGKDFDKTGYIDRLIETNKPHGLNSLIQSLDNGRILIFARKWSEVFAEFEIKHKHLNDKLILERERLLNKQNTAESTIEEVAENTAVQPKEIVLPNEKK